MHLRIFQNQRNSTYAPDIWHSLTQIIFPAEHEDSSEYLQRSMKSFYFNFTEVQLIYNAVLITAVQQSDLVIHTCMLLHFFSIMVYHKILNIAPSVKEQDLATYLFYTYLFASANLKLPVQLSLIPSPLATASAFSMPLILFLFHRQFRQCHILNFTHK